MSHVDIATLVTRVEALEAAQQIQCMKAHYGELVDARYTTHGVKDADTLQALGDEIAALFTEDAVWDGGSSLGLCEGRAAIAERFRTPSMHFTWHFFVKPRIQVDGDTAIGTWDIFAPCTQPDGKACWMAGVEHDRYRRENGRWLHTHMKLDVVFMAPYETGWIKPPR